MDFGAAVCGLALAIGWVRTLYVIHSGAPLCLALVGFLPLAMVEAGGQMGASGTLCISGDGVLVLLCLYYLLGTGVS